MAGWTSADLLDRFQMYLGRGNGGLMAADELWTTARCYTWLADAQEAVYADLAPIVPAAFVGAPSVLTSADGGVTYTFPSGTYPFGHVEVYARENGGRELYASTYGNPSGDFVIEGSTIRAPGNRTRTYASGPYARYTAFPSRLSASVEPSINPEPARELILWKALQNAAEVSAGAMDPEPWRTKYEGTEAERRQGGARMRWLQVWQTQYASKRNSALPNTTSRWWLTLDAMNGAS